MDLPAFPNRMRTHMRYHEKAKTFLVVKLTTILLLAGCLQLSAKSYGQLITLSKKNASLQEVFLDIYRQTGYYFMCKDDLLESAKRIDINVKKATLKEVLDICFKNQPLEYTISDHVIVVIKINPASFEIKGRVTNEKGEPLEATAVLIKGTRRGTQTNKNGEFSLKIEGEENIELEISYTGYVTKTIVAKPGVFVNTQLAISTNPLDQIQVIAYGTTSKRLNTGDVSSVTADAIAEQPVTNFLATIEGRIPGLYIQEYNGVPGTAFSVQLRGQNSIANGNDPLYIIDGVPFPSQPIGSSYVNGSIIGGGNPLNGINTSDIERVDVLKDGDATAIYGSRGANGVILITTKKGIAGQTKVDLNFYTGFGQITRRMNLLNTSNYLIMRNEAFSNDQATPGPYDYDLTSWDTTRYTDWQKQLLGGSALLTSVQGSVSGGTKNTQVFLSGSYQNETTVFPGDFKDQKGSVFANMAHTSFDEKFKVTFSASYLVEHSVLPSGDPTSSALMLAPDAPPPFDSTGKLNWPPGFANPYGVLWSTYKSQASNLISNAVLSYQILKTLQIKASLGYTAMETNETKIFPSSSLNPAYANFQQPSSQFNVANLNTWILEPQLIWHTTVKKNQWEALVGTTFQQTTITGQTLLATGFSSDLSLENMAAASNISPEHYNNTLYRYEGFFARLNFNHDQKYLLNVVGRRDGSSRFGPGNQFANFGAIGAGWIFSNEQLIKEKLPGLSFGKIRASYGITGNDQIGDYQYLSNWGYTTYPYNNTVGSYPLNLANQNYSWEINKKFELGLELGFLKDAILFSTSYFQNRSSSQLVGYSLPSTTGFNTVQANLPAVVENSGWEFQLSTTNINRNNFSWKTTLNLTIPFNVLLSYPGLAASPYANTYQVGKSLYIQKAFAYEGVDPQAGIYVYQSVQTAKPTASPVYPDDLQANKQISKKYYGGFLNTFQYKNWMLDVFVQFVSQTGRNYIYSFGAPGFMGNQPNYVLSRWQQPGNITNVQKFTQDYGSEAFAAYSNATYYGDNSIGNASFIRVKNISLSYQFPAKTISKLKISGAKLFCRAQNLFTITSYQGMDPEAQYTSNLPPLRMLIAGFQITL